MRQSVWHAGALVLAVVLGMSACAPASVERPAAEATTPSQQVDSEATSETASEAAPAVTEDPGPAVSDGAPRRATLRIPALGVRVEVVPYRGWTDDAPGTEIQDGGLAASPHGPRGGVGPGGVGNYQVTAHRTSSTRAFEFLPDLRRGERVWVDVRRGGVTTRYVYRVSDTRETSFRSPRSLRAQRAAVPGRPGVEPTRAMITLSTCATPEDHAEGNFWSDEFNNPEHRIDKIGVLVRTRRLGK
jgi:sortase A